MTVNKTPSDGYAGWPRWPCKNLRMNKEALDTVHRWEAAKGLPPEICDIVGSDAELEYAVPGLKVSIPDRCHGDSRCDVFARVKTGHGIGGIGITSIPEKGFGEVIHKWRGHTEDWQERLSTVCSALETRNPPPPDMCYKPFHRLAAAIYVADKHGADFAGMIVQSFSQRRKGYDDFEAFCDLLDAKLVPGKPCRTKLKSGRRILLAWVDS